MLFLPLHIGDWVTSTQYLSPTERGVYLDLLVRYYSQERPLTEEECKRISKCNANAYAKEMQYVLQTFFTLEDGVYHNHRADEEIAAFKVKSSKRRQAAQARWDKVQGKGRVSEEGVANAMQMHSKCNALPISDIRSNKEIQKKSSAPAEKHEVFHCPEGIKPEAWDAWMQVRKAKKAGTMTSYAWSRFCATAKRAGLTPAGAVDFCVDHAWQGLNAEWLKDKDLSRYKNPSLGSSSDQDRVQAALQRSLERRRQESLV